MNTPRPAFYPGTRGFTFVELTVAMAILVMICLFMVQIFNATNQTTKISNRAIDATSQARLAMDCIGRDMANRINRPDIPFEARNPTVPGDSILQFFSAVTSAVPALAPDANRGISSLSYRVAPHPDNADKPCLVRGGKAIAWDAGAGAAAVGFFGLGTNGLPIRWSDLPAEAKIDEGDYDVLAPGVVRVLIGFQLIPDNLPVVLEDGTSLPNAQGQIVYSPPMRSMVPPGGGAAVQYIDPSRIGSVIVGVVAVDLKTLELMTKGDIETLAAAFQVPATNETPLERWHRETEDFKTFDAGVSLPVRQAVRVFQRFVPVSRLGDSVSS